MIRCFYYKAETVSFFGASAAQTYFEDLREKITRNKNSIYDAIQSAKLFSYSNKLTN
jgi:hypothetical protein